MLNFHIDEDHGIIFLSPDDKIRITDLDSISQKVDAYLAEKGKLHGLLINLPSLPHWENFQAMVQHFRFVRDHQKKVEKIAVVSDVIIAPIASALLKHFLAAEVRYFHARNSYDARLWLEESESGKVIPSEIKKPVEIHF